VALPLGVSPADGRFVGRLLNGRFVSARIQVFEEPVLIERTADPGDPLGLGWLANEWNVGRSDTTFECGRRTSARPFHSQRTAHQGACGNARVMS
jgi:hypothetical protein